MPTPPNTASSRPDAESQSTLRRGGAYVFFLDLLDHTTRAFRFLVLTSTTLAELDFDTFLAAAPTAENGEGYRVAGLVGAQGS